MKYHTRIWTLFTASLAVATAVFSTPLRAEVKQGEAVVAAIDGTAEYSTDGRNWIPLKVKDVLKPGAEIKTSPTSTVDLYLNYNGPVVRADKDSHLVLTRLSREEKGQEIVTDTFLTLKLGSVLGFTQKIAKGSRYSIATPDGIVDITGTQYRVSTSGFVGVLVGSVTVRYSKRGTAGLGVSVTVNAGQEFNSTTGLVQPYNGADFASLLQDVETSVGNVRKFNLANGAKVQVTAITPPASK